MESSERSNPRHYDPEGPRGVLRRSADGAGPKRWWPITVIVALSLVGSLWWVTRSPIFSARQVEVTGASHLSRAKVLRLAGVGPGTNLFWLHTGAPEAKLERNPWIADAEVTRSLPSTLRITIHERTAVAQFPRDGDFLVVATDGTILARRPVRRDLPLLTIDSATMPDHQRLGRSAWVVGAMSPWLRERVTRVLRTSDGSIVVHLQSGIPVYFGEAIDIQQKDQALAAVLRWALTGDHPVESINVQAPLAPTAKLYVYVPPVVVPVDPSAKPSPKASPGASPSPSPSPSASAKESPSPHRETVTKGMAPKSKRHGRHPRH